MLGGRQAEWQNNQAPRLHQTRGERGGERELRERGGEEGGVEREREREKARGRERERERERERGCTRVNEPFVAGRADPSRATTLGNVEYTFLWR